MQAHHSSPKKASTYRSTTPPPLDSSSEDLDICIDCDLEDLENIVEPPRKPHFLDYDYIPSPGYDEIAVADKTKKISSTSQIQNINRVSSNTANNIVTGEDVKIDKKYERDGEISDYVLAGKSGVNNPKREKFVKSLSSSCNTERINGNLFTTNCNINNVEYVEPINSINKTGATKKKHFLDEAVPPTYNINCNNTRVREREREHRSLDRNFERYAENLSWKYERKLSLERDGAPIFAAPKFLDRDVSPVYNRGTWPTDKPNNDIQSIYSQLPSNDFSSQLGPKVECVYSLLSMLGSNDSGEMSQKFLELSKSPESCIALRRSGCIPLLVQMMHSDADEMARKRAGMALHNVVHCHPDDKVGRREAKVLRLIEQIMEYNDFLKNFLKNGESVCDDLERHPQQAIYSLMKISFDEDHRYAMCQLGALPSIANLVYLDHAAHGSQSTEQRCITLRRYSGMALTNLTFQDGNNKVLLCSNKNFMKSLVDQLDSSPEELIQVTACVLRNLSWRADENMKTILNEIGTVTALTKAAMKNRNENTLKSILSALWNLTAHCSMNKAELCNVEGALAFLADMLVYEAPGKNLTIVENAGGILRNLSSHIAVREDYRKILRQRNCLGILLQQLKSESLTVVSNACGTLWNLSARCPEDQKYLCDNGAVPMLRSLVHSKHKMISNGSNAALKNLLNFKPTGLNLNSLDPIAKSMNLKELPTLNMRKQRALEEDLDQNLSETCENIDVVTPPKEENNVQDFCTLDQATVNYHQSQIKPSKPPSSLYARPSANSSITQASSIVVDDRMKFGEQLPIVVGAANPKTTLDSQKPSTSSNLISKPNKLQSQYNSDESEEYDQLTDFSRRYNRESDRKSHPHPATVSPVTIQKSSSSPEESTVVTYGVYQETDLDQITDYSLRYAEHNEDKITTTQAAGSFSNEILLTLEDTVKCYETEGTPYTISNATSMSDLRNHDPDKILIEKNKTGLFSNIVSGINTPEKPVNYCEEGTPGYFSRRDSISSIDEVGILSRNNNSNSSNDNPKIANKILANKTEMSQNMPVNIPEMDEDSSGVIAGAVNSTDVVLSSTPGGSATKNVTFVDFALETPLMFSRRSSLESLSSALPNYADDRSSVVSDFSRLASGIISPSELPDSPSQSMPQTPRTVERTQQAVTNNRVAIVPPLRSVFEDDVNTFDVENTPAQFSCATSLSNLSLDDEPKISKDLERVEGEPKVCSVNVESRESMPSTSNNIENKNQVENIEPLPSRVVYSKDDVINYCTEDTPAILSKQGSTTNLSLLSMETNNKIDLSDDSSNDSDDSHAKILEECIREGMKKSVSKDRIAVGGGGGGNSNATEQVGVVKENPIAMLRTSSLLPPYPVVRDEICKFNVEDSPCNFSVVSALSNLTIDSENAARLAQRQKPHQNVAESNNVENVEEIHSGNPIADDSLSSLSADSEEDNILLNQAIAAGFEARPRSNLSKNVPSQPQVPLSLQPSSSRHAIANHQPDAANDSLSSIDSSDSNENQHKSLLEQCIRSGMNKRAKKPVSENVNLTPKKSGLPSRRVLSHSTERDRSANNKKDRDKNDEQLLQECINIGIAKSIRGSSNVKQSSSRVISQSIQQQQQRNSQLNTNNLEIQNNSKNGEATSVVVSDMKSAPCTTQTTDVEKESLDGTKELNGDHFQLTVTSMKQNGYSISSMAGPLDTSSASLNMFLNQSDILERSNEYPALKLSNFTETTTSSMNNSSIDMNMSNEFLMDDNELMNESTTSQTNSKIDKHKDPDLMLKSVERLTLELVSTAEYLRTNNSTNDDSSSLNNNRNDGNTDKKSSGSNTNNNNTWNEDTCPNDVSFPSISMTAPMIGSMNEDDATFSDFNPPKSWVLEEATPTNEMRDFLDGGCGERAMVADDILRDASFDATLTFDAVRKVGGEYQEYESLEPESNTMTTQICGNNQQEKQTTLSSPTTNGINFELGGEVKQPFLQGQTVMTNSIIALEATKVLNDLKYFPQMADSTTSLDLDNIRPPSIMENLSMSGYFEMSRSPQLSRSRKKSLPAGLFARRAIGQSNPSGSLESVNSSYNLDNIKPPSIMDELLDSMISVASITSEIADSNLDGTSHYETALSDIDDTMTLQSCMDFPNDSTTPIPSDFSSVESTPKKSSKNSSKRNLTPKQKRQMIKDRYRTYTIAADMVLKEKVEELRMNEDERGDDEILQIEIDESAQPKLTPRQKRQENRSRFQTQILDSSGLGSSSSIEGQHERPPNSHRGSPRRDNPERFKTQVINGFSDVNLSASNDDEDDDDDASIRALTERFKHINSPYTSYHTAKKNCNIIAAAELISKYNISANNSGTSENEGTSIEFDQNSGTESSDQREPEEGSGDFRTFTRSSPRIVKRDQDSNPPSSPEVVKTVRGTKKPAYVSPYRRQIVSSGTSRTTSPKHNSPTTNNVRTNLANKFTTDKKNNIKSPAAANLIPKNHTIVSKTHVVINKTNLTKKINAVKSNKTGVVETSNKTVTNNVKRNSLAIKGGSNERAGKVESPAVQTIDRQGTFVKDEPTNEDVPVVLSAPASPSKIPKPPTSKFYSQKGSVSTATTPKSPAKTIMSKLRIPIHKSASMDADKLASAQKKPNTAPVIGTNPNNFASPSSSASSLLSNNNDLLKRRSLGVIKSPSVPTVPQRSKTNVTMKNNKNLQKTQNSKIPATTPPSRSNSTISKANITSKIAGLWKKTDEKKSTTTTGVANGNNIDEGKKLIRSTTFDNTPPPPASDDGNCNNERPPANVTPSKLLQIASRYRGNETTGGGTTKNRCIKSPSAGNIKSIAAAGGRI